ncbi:uncharacterized protein EDB93DRAFT_1331697 [Suillus bovinus]|uniref:uncharacterized protein n=1 Tax=Suillus bovinus TaxID=48563 RepID=UPI001B86296A|nr:uncharacterized protein EDB93DRAFT_1331697 [Suillus bovinus]KAG2132448.1 hypothetical protein EDB93DRAFT_1331697 [Suillus bovinus]
MVAPIVNTGIQTAKYCNVAGLGVLIFDYFLTLEPEVRWTWNRRWNVTRILFVISRYMAFVAAGMTSYAAIATRANENCSRFGQASNAIHIISIVSSEGLLIIRTYAFWRKNNKLLAVLLVLAAISIGCAVSITDVVSNLAAPTNPSDPPTSNCTFEASRSSAIQYGFLAAYELCEDISFPFHLARLFNPIHLVLLSLTIFKRYQDYRDCNSHLVKVIFQGGVRYMTATISVSVANILVTYMVPQSYDEIMDLPQLVLHSMLASRVLFDLHASDRNEWDEATLQISTFYPV